VHETVVITANGSQVDLPADYAGGQVARGGRLGLFGNIDMMNIPFGSTNYTAQYIRDQQANSVADIVQGDPAVRVARGYGNFQELYVVRGFPIYSDDMSYDGLYACCRGSTSRRNSSSAWRCSGCQYVLNGARPAAAASVASSTWCPSERR